MTTDPAFTADDARFMARALQLARRGYHGTHPNPRVGCVLVRDGQIIGEGWHERAGQAHAEVRAIQNAAVPVAGATAYVTLEPCCHQGRTGPCTLALLDADVRRVVAAMTDPNPNVSGQGLGRLRAAGVQVEVGLLQAQAERLNRGFCRRMKSGRPWVFSKLAMSLDGRTAMASGESKWITGPASRRDVHRLRAGTSAIVTGVDTVLADDPELTPRDLDFEPIRMPDRVVLDTQLRTPPSARLFQVPGRTCVLTACDDADRIQSLVDVGAEVFRLPQDRGHLDPHAVLDWCGEQAYNEVMIEAGARLNGALMQAGLVDEWYLYVAPRILGDSARGVFHLPQLQQLSQTFGLKIEDSRRIGDDTRLHLTQVETD